MPRFRQALHKTLGFTSNEQDWAPKHPPPALEDGQNYDEDEGRSQADPAEVLPPHTPLLSLKAFITLPQEIRDKIVQHILPPYTTQYSPNMELCRQILSLTRLDLSTDSQDDEISLKRLIDQVRADVFFRKVTIDLTVESLRTTEWAEMKTSVQRVSLRLEPQYLRGFRLTGSNLSRATSRLAGCPSLQSMDIVVWHDPIYNKSLDNVLCIVEAGFVHTAEIYGDKVKFLIDSPLFDPRKTKKSGGTWSRWSGTFAELVEMRKQQIGLPLIDGKTLGGSDRQPDWEWRRAF